MGAVAPCSTGARARRRTLGPRASRRSLPPRPSRAESSPQPPACSEPERSSVSAGTIAANTPRRYPCARGRNREADRPRAARLPGDRRPAGRRGAGHPRHRPLFVREKVLPDVGDWFEQGILPRELISELGKLGLFGMHLDGYGLPGASAVAYGLTCLELEAGDSGVRSARLGPGLARDVLDLALGLRGAEAALAAADAHGRGDRLLRADRAGRGLRPGLDAHPRPAATAPTGSSTAPRCGSRTAPSPTSPPSGHAPTTAPSAASWSRRACPVQRAGDPQEALAPGLRHLRARPPGRARAGREHVPRGRQRSVGRSPA